MGRVALVALVALASLAPAAEAQTARFFPVVRVGDDALRFAGEGANAEGFLAREQSDAETLSLFLPSGDAASVFGCDAAAVAPGSLSASDALVVLRGECSFSDKGRVAQAAGAGMIFVVSALDSLYANFSDFLADPCSTDCRDSESADEATCAADSGCESGICARNPLSGPGNFCCVADNLLRMALDDDVESALAAVFVGFDAAAGFLEAAAGGADVQVFEEDAVRVDGSAVVILLLGTLVTAGASYRAARKERSTASWLWTTGGLPARRRASTDSERSDEEAGTKVVDDEIESVTLTSSAMVAFLLFSSASLIGLFYVIKAYPQETIIAIQVLFGISSIFALSHFVLRPVIAWLWPALKRKRVVVARGRLLGSGDEVAGTLVAIGVVLWWFIERHEPYAFVLLNLLAASVCAMFLVAVRLPNLRLACFMMALFFVYDVFMVFITPKFFGESVMVEVATAGGSTASSADGNTVCERTQEERLPMLFMVPRFDDPSAFALLGLGDVFIPGLLVTYACRFDYLKAEAAGSRTSWLKAHGYFLPICFAYFCGLTVTLAANILGVTFSTEVKGQPALLYLVPFTSVTFLVLAALRGDLRLLWSQSYDELVVSMLGAHGHDVNDALRRSQASVSIAADEALHGDDRDDDLEGLEGLEGSVEGDDTSL